MPHPFGTVLGARRIGRKVTIVQGVMVGAVTVGRDFDPAQRPLIGDNLVLNADCKVFGGIALGDRVTVGAKSLVIRSVPPNPTVLGIPAKVIFQPPSAESSKNLERAEIKD